MLYHEGKCIDRHCHTTGAGVQAIVRILRPVVLSQLVAACEREWELLWVVMSALNPATVISTTEQQRFKTDALAFVSLIQESFHR